ncbi:transcriptional regulator [Sphingobium jiangsuense]|uniref:DNA-binding transcriptional LysR family regulator n=1 Tax=Sphingobium jiangsuense TaxID=870476 RepID=A0A7W6FP18_9SPHN|nr:LysR substrate-binding domain-containing protein [Sphingobium jiangsuense]MBB3925092.1 DNA-binding transcriptional LysR family regulator [Sphingobium jiangsuense]GLT00081.1 transcriptional regulator [Sphingobium jiangsuense]
MSNRWHGIDEFVAVATTGSFANAAKMLQMPTSTVSRAVARLEAQVRAQLFYRTTRKVVLTENGRVFVDHCRRIIAEREEAFAALSATGEPGGELRITCSTALGEGFVAPIVQDFCLAWPQLSVTLDLSNRIVDLIAEGYDLAIRTGDLSDSRMVRTRIAARRLYSCASPGYLAASGTPQEIEDLEGHNCLIGSSANWHFEVGGADRVFRPKGRWRCNSGEAVARAALAGIGICQLPEFYVLRHLASGALVEVLPDYRRREEPIWAVYPERRHLMPKVRLLVDSLKERLGPALVAIS